MKKRFIIASALIIAFALLATMVYANLSTGAKAPDFTVPTVDGKSFTLSKSLKNNKVIVLDIWATWCPPCRGEIPHLVKLQKSYLGKKVKVVGVAIDSGTSAVKAFVKDNKVTYTIGLDPDANKLGEPYKVEGIPATYILDKKGTVRFVHSGFPSDTKSQNEEIKRIKKEIRTIMDEK